MRTDKWNGVGGKQEEGESIREATVREAHEEICVTIDPHHLEKVATIAFSSRHNPKLNWQVHCFVAREWQGEPQETEEMRPQWFSEEAIPYDTMWPDDKLWLPKVLAGKKLIARFAFDITEQDFEDHDIQEVVSLEE